MDISFPPYYTRFRCLAGGCPDSCCQEWDVQVDAVSAAYYRSLPGALGERLRQVLRDEDGQTLLTIEDGRCPMWRQDGLCRIQAELGEEALCHVCRTFPRLRHDYGDFAELGLELSCPEAARLILSAPPAAMITESQPGGDAPEYDRQDMALLRSTRETALSFLSDPAYTPAQALALLLVWGYQAQSLLDGLEVPEFDPQAVLASAGEMAAPGDFAPIRSLFRELEILTPRWRSLLEAPVPRCLAAEDLAIARYLVQRYWLQAISDFDLVPRVKFIVLSCLLIAHLGSKPVETAQLFSKEIENDADNVDALLDAVCMEACLTDDRLLGLLLLG